MTVITVIGALEGLVFAQLVKVSRLYISVVAAGFGLAATLVTIFAQNMALVFLGAALAGAYLTRTLPPELPEEGCAA